LGDGRNTRHSMRYLGIGDQKEYDGWQNIIVQTRAHCIGGSGLARPASGFFSGMLTLLYASGLRWGPNDSGLAEWDSDPCRPSYVDVGLHDFHCLSQTQPIPGGSWLWSRSRRRLV